MVRKEKLSPRYIRPYEVLEQIDIVIYRLTLSPELSAVHDVFHVSMLKKYIRDPSHVLEPNVIVVQENLCFEEKKEKKLFIDSRQKEKTLRNKEIPLVKVL